MSQRTQLGVDKALEESSDSMELDEQMEEQVDRMLNEREVKDREDKIEARKQSILAKRKVLNIKATDKTIVDDKDPKNLSQSSSNAFKSVSRKVEGGTTELVKKNTIEAKNKVNQMWRELSNEKEKQKQVVKQGSE